MTNQKPSLLQEALRLFDANNSKDPNQEIHDGRSYAKEVLYSNRMSECLKRFIPNASEELKLATHSQHIQRWEVPRANYPEGRVGYLTWRKYLYTFHASKAAKILQKVGYSEAMIEKVKIILQKKKLNQKENSDSQNIEDVVCLVFLQYYLQDFSRKHSSEKVQHILKKTWNKMSQKGKDAAQKLNLNQATLELLEKPLHSSHSKQTREELDSQNILPRV